MSLKIRKDYVKFYCLKELGITSDEYDQNISVASTLLRDKWIESGFKDYSIYQDPLYVYDMIHLYFLMTRNSVSFCLKSLPKINTVLDYYNGIGLSTIQFAKNRKDVQVYYYNSEKEQIEFMNGFKKRLYINDSILEMDRKIKYDVIMVFEVFEHYEDPFLMFKTEIMPFIGKYLVYSSLFGELWGGHFPEYSGIKAKKYGKEFRRLLTEVGFKEIGRGFNQRPFIFEKIN